MYFVGPDDEPDKYRLRRQVGGGGEAELWQADVTISGGSEPVAVKILRSRHVAELGRWQERWADQVELLRLIRHPGVVGVHCHFTGALMHREGETTDSGKALYLVMNWVDGQDLRDWVPQHTSPDDRFEGLRYLAQIADVLDYLHSGDATPSRRRVIHGDISPANVIINADGQVVLVDFGLFQVARHVTATPAGTPGYCAPEVLRDGAYDYPSDRYAFGGLAYYVLTGNHPPADRDELLRGLRTLAATTPYDGVTFEHLAAIFATDPAARPAAGEWIRGLRLQSSTAPVRTTGLPPRAPQPSPSTAGVVLPAAHRRRMRIWAAVGAAAAVGVTVLAIALPASSDDSGRHPERSAGQQSNGVTASPLQSASPLASPSTVLPSSPPGPASASSAAASSVTPAKETFLVNLQPYTTEFLQGDWSVNGVTYRQSLACDHCFSDGGTVAFYELGGRYRHFLGTLATGGSDNAYLLVTLDEQDTVERVASGGHPVVVDIDVTAVKSLKIELTADFNVSNLIVLGQARLGQ